MRDEYLIRKGGFFYRPHSSGYTCSPAEAGRYTLDDAEWQTHPNGPDGPRDGMTYHHVSEFPELSYRNRFRTWIRSFPLPWSAVPGR